MVKVKIKKNKPTEHSHLFIVEGMPFFSNFAKTKSETHLVDIFKDQYETSFGDENGEHTIELRTGQIIKSIKTNDLEDIEIRKRVNLQVQQVFVSNERFQDVAEATQWVGSKGFENREVKTTQTGFIFPQMARDRFKEESLKPFELQDGVTLSVGVLDPEKMDDLKNPSFDRMQDKQDPSKLALKDEQVARLANLKDEISKIISEVRSRAESLIPVVAQFVEFSEAKIQNEAFDNFLTGFIDSFELLSTNLAKLKLEPVKVDMSGKNFEQMIREVLPLIKNSRKIFENSESFSNLGQVFALNDENFEQMLINIPFIKQETGENSDVAKFLNSEYNLNQMTDAELEFLEVEELSKTRIQPFEYDESKATILWKKFFDPNLKASLSLNKNEINTSDDVRGIGFEKDLVYDVNKMMPFPSNSLDEIIAHEALETSIDNENRAKIFKDVHRLLKTGGTFKIKAASTRGDNAFLPTNKSYWNGTVVKMFAEENNFEVEYIETEINDEMAFIKTTLRKK